MSGEKLGYEKTQIHSRGEALAVIKEYEEKEKANKVEEKANKAYKEYRERIKNNKEEAKKSFGTVDQETEPMETYNDFYKKELDKVFTSDESNRYNRALTYINTEQSTNNEGKAEENDGTSNKAKDPSIYRSNPRIEGKESIDNKEDLQKDRELVNSWINKTRVRELTDPQYFKDPKGYYKSMILVAHGMQTPEQQKEFDAAIRRLYAANHPIEETSSATTPIVEAKMSNKAEKKPSAFAKTLTKIGVVAAILAGGGYVTKEALNTLAPTNNSEKTTEKADVDLGQTLEDAASRAMQAAGEKQDEEKYYTGSDYSYWNKTDKKNFINGKEVSDPGAYCDVNDVRKELEEQGLPSTDKDVLFTVARRMPKLLAGQLSEFDNDDIRIDALKGLDFLELQEAIKKLDEDQMNEQLKLYHDFLFSDAVKEEEVIINGKKTSLYMVYTDANGNSYFPDQVPEGEELTDEDMEIVMSEISFANQKAVQFSWVDANGVAHSTDPFMITEEGGCTQPIRFQSGLYVIQRNGSTITRKYYPNDPNPEPEPEPTPTPDTSIQPKDAEKLKDLDNKYEQSISDNTGGGEVRNYESTNPGPVTTDTASSSYTETAPPEPVQSARAQEATPVEAYVDESVNNYTVNETPYVETYTPVQEAPASAPTVEERTPDDTMHVEDAGNLSVDDLLELP